MVFVDTSAWIALTDRSDQYHKVATQIYTRLKRERTRLVTTDYVLDETITRLRYDSGHGQAVRFLNLIEQAEQARTVRRITVSDDIFQAALGLFRRYDSVALSFTDCTSFSVCQRYAVAEAFAFDQHFSMMGIPLSSA